MIDETFLTTDEVLEYLQINLRTVYRLIKAGKIPAVRVGRQWRFRKTDIDAWLARERSHTIPAPAASGGAHPGARSGGPRRVLVVDDEESIRDLLAKTLALAEYEVSIWRRTDRWRWSRCGSSAMSSSLPTSRCRGWMGSPSFTRPGG